MVLAVHTETSRTRIGVQASSIATVAATMKDIEILGGGAGPLAKLMQKTEPNRAQVRRRREYKAPIKLTKAGSPVELATNVKGLASVLGTSATPVAYTNASALSHQLLLRMLLGAELTPAAGSTVASSSGTPVDTVTVASGHGSRFVIGQIIVIERADAAPWVRRVTGISTDALTVFPPLDDSPATSAVVRNCYQYYPGETDSTTFTVEHTAVESSTPITQKRAIGVFGGGEFKLENDSASELSFKGECLDWTGPDDLSISDDPVADDMGDPLVWSPTFYLGMTSGAAPTVAADVASIKVSVPRKWQKVPGSVVNGVGSVHEVAGRGEPIEVSVESLYDNAWWSRFASDTALNLLAYTAVGTGSSARVFGFYFPNIRVVETPADEVKEALAFATAKLRAYQATDISGATPALSTAQIRTTNCIVFLG